MVCACASTSSGKPNPRWHRVFLKMVPKIVRHAKFSFRHLRSEARQDFIQEVVANAFVAFEALVRRGKMSLAYPTVLARYAAAQIKDGRRVGASLNVHDVLSGYAQKHKGFKVERLDHYDVEDKGWHQILVEDKTCGPADIARTRIDFGDWLGSIKRRDRRIAEFLALGNRTDDTARKFKVSEGRVSQLRRELGESWKKFTGEEDCNAA